MTKSYFSFIYGHVKTHILACFTFFCFEWVVSKCIWKCFLFSFCFDTFRKRFVFRVKYVYGLPVQLMPPWHYSVSSRTWGSPCLAAAVGAGAAIGRLVVVLGSSSWGSLGCCRRLGCRHCRCCLRDNKMDECQCHKVFFSWFLVKIIEILLKFHCLTIEKQCFAIVFIEIRWKTMFCVDLQWKNMKYLILKRR